MTSWDPPWCKWASWSSDASARLWCFTLLLCAPDFSEKCGLFYLPGLSSEVFLSSLPGWERSKKALSLC